MISRHHIYCRYAEFTWDVPENQIIRQVAHLLSGWGFRASLCLRLSRLDAALAEVRPTALPSSVFGRFRYTRFNEDYKQIHQLCRLFLEGSSLHEQLGVWDSRAFLLDMNRLFEIFVTELLQARADGGQRVAAQSELPLGEDGKVNMRPDLLIRSTAGPVVVADCKYKQTESESYKNHDFYQVLAYCIASGTHRGLLIYPFSVGAVEDIVKVRHMDAMIEQITINLGVPLSDFRSECERFALAVIARATEPQLTSAN